MMIKIAENLLEVRRKMNKSSCEIQEYKYLKNETLSINGFIV